MGNSTGNLRRKTMFHFIKQSFVLLIILGFSSEVYSEEVYKSRIVAEFDNPSKAGTLIIYGGEGNIKINGYNGKQVIVNATSNNIEAIQERSSTGKTKGLKEIYGEPDFDVESIENENIIKIIRPMGENIDLDVQVPVNTNLKIGTNISKEASNKTNPVTNSVTLIPLINLELDENETDINYTIGELVQNRNGLSVIFSNIGFNSILDGNVNINNISGEIEIKILDGDLSLFDISGVVNASITDGDIVIKFNKSDFSKPIFLSTIDGDIDVTMPSSTKADLTLKTIDGSVYTDFEIEINDTKQVTRKDRNNETFFGLPGKKIAGKINNGTNKIQISTIDGDIYIRKGN